MTSFTATYSPDDNKLRLYASARLDAETYARIKAAGFRWAPVQSLFIAPMWTPERLRTMAEASGGTYEPLPAGSFEASGTNVNAALVVVEG
jgi:hypothetical protein